MTYPLDSQDWSRPWHSINDGHAALAQFASTKCLSEVDLAQHHQADVLLKDGPEQVSRNIFQQLVDLDLGYNLDTWSAEVGQLIRDPRSIQKGSGTCLDLALLFCAMAKDAGLRPYLAVATGLTGDHAFVVIDKAARAGDPDVKSRAANKKLNPIWASLDEETLKHVDVDHGLPINELLTAEFDTVDIAGVLPASWLPIDPTDVCRSTLQHPRNHSFEDSVRGITTNLRGSFDRVVLIDVVRAHAHGYPELDPRPDAERPVIFRRVPTVVGYHEISSRRNLVEDLAQRSGYVVLAGDPGAGKSLAASLVATRAAGGAGWFLNAEDSGTLKVELAEAAMSQLGLDPMGLEGKDINAYATRAFEILESVDARWVVVLDNANLRPGDYGRLPVPGQNQLVLVTTTNTDGWSRWVGLQHIPSSVELMEPLSDLERQSWPGATDIADLPSTPLLLNLTVRVAALGALPSGRDEGELVAAALDACDETVQETARTLSLIPAVPVSVRDLAKDPETAETAAVQLGDLGLTQTLEGNRVAMHRLIRAAVRDALADDDLDGQCLAHLLLDPSGARYFEAAATIAELDQFAGLLERSGLPDAVKAECLAALGSFQERKDSKASAAWFELALKQLPDPTTVREPRQAELIAACLQGVVRAVLRNETAETEELRGTRRRLEPILAMADQFPDTQVRIAVSRADAMDALLRRKLAAEIDDALARRIELEAALDQLERSAALREDLIQGDSPDIDRSRFNIPGTLIGLAKAVDGSEVGPILDRAESIYREVYDIRVRRYRTESLEEVITCVHGQGVVNYYRAVLLPEISVEDRLDYLKTSLTRALKAMDIRESLAWLGGISGDSLKSARLAAKVLLLEQDLAARMHDTSGKRLAKPDAFDKLVREAGKEHELLAAALEETE